MKKRTINAIIHNKITECEVLRQNKEGSMRIKFCNFESVWFEEMEISSYNNDCAFVYHNEMTDEDVAFTCRLAMPLHENEHLFTEFFTTEDSNRFYELQNEMEKHGIIAQNVEDLKYFDFYHILKTRSFRW